MYKCKPVLDTAKASIALPKCMYTVKPVVTFDDDANTAGVSDPSASLEKKQDAVMKKIEDLQTRLRKLDTKASKATSNAAKPTATSATEVDETKPPQVAANISVTIPIRTSRPVLYALLDMLTAHKRVGKLRFHVHHSANQKKIEPFPERFTIHGDTTGLGVATNLLTIRIVTADVSRVTVTSDLSKRSVSGVSALKYLASLVGRRGLYDEDVVSAAVAHDEALDFVDSFATDPTHMLKALEARLDGVSIVPGTAKGILTLADLYLYSALTAVPSKSIEKQAKLGAYVNHLRSFAVIKATLL